MTVSSIGTGPLSSELLAVESPLSIQAHPDAEQAKAGFEADEAIAAVVPEYRGVDGAYRAGTALPIVAARLRERYERPACQ